MMRHIKIVAAILLLVSVVGIQAGCGTSIKGPRFWWDDKKRESLPADYRLPERVDDTSEPEDLMKDAPAKPATPKAPNESNAGAFPKG